MAVTGAIPIGRMPVDYLTQGTTAINDILQKARQAALQHQQLQEMAKFHGADLAMREKSLNASHKFDGLKQMILQQQLQGLKQKNDPNAKWNALMNLQKHFQGMGGNQQIPQEDSNNFMAALNPNQQMNGQGAMQDQSPFISELQQPTEIPKESGNMMGQGSINGVPIQELMRALTYEAAGLKAPSANQMPLQGGAREVADLKRYGEQVGFDSPEYKQAESIVKAKEANRERHNRGFKPGENPVFDKDSGEEIGIQRDYSPAEKKEVKGRAYINDAFHFMNKALSYYSGEHSIDKFTKDVRSYKTDKSAKKRIDDFFTAKNMLASNTIKENATIGGSNTYKSFEYLNNSLNATDIPKRLESIIKQYSLPAEVQRNAGKDMLRRLNRATNASEDIPAKHIEYYDPNKQAEQEIDSKHSADEVNTEAAHFKTTPSMIKKAIKLGIETEDEMWDWLEEQK